MRINLPFISYPRSQVLMIPAIAIGLSAIMCVLFFFLVFGRQSGKHQQAHDALVRAKSQVTTFKRNIATSRTKKDAPAIANLLTHIHSNTEAYVSDINANFINHPKFNSIQKVYIHYKHDANLDRDDRKFLRDKSVQKSELTLHVRGSFRELGEYVFHIMQLPFLFNIQYINIENKAKVGEDLNMSLSINFYFITSQ